MIQRHRTITPRIARMLHELAGPGTRQIRAADVAKLAADRDGYAQRRTARQGLITAATLIAAAFAAAIVWQAFSVETVTATGASTELEVIGPP